MNFFEFFDEYKKCVSEATPEQINKAFKISGKLSCIFYLPKNSTV